MALKQDQFLLVYIREAFKALDTDFSRTSQGRKLPLISHLPIHRKVRNRLLKFLEKHELVIRQGSSIIPGNEQTPVKASQVQHEHYRIFSVRW